MPLQRACVAESQVRNKSSNGPPRVQGNENLKGSSEYSATWGIRQLPEICWYLAERARFIYVKQGGTADLYSYKRFVPDRMNNHSVRDFFILITRR